MKCSKCVLLGSNIVEPRFKDVLSSTNFLFGINNRVIDIIKILHTHTRGRDINSELLGTAGKSQLSQIPGKYVLYIICSYIRSLSGNCIPPIPLPPNLYS